MKKQNVNVNIIKFFAAILVLLAHSYALAANAFDPLEIITSGAVDFGNLGVAIFFFFSGYYITGSLYNNGCKNFMKRRLKRIIPCLGVVVLVTVFVLGPLLTNLSLAEYFSNKGTYLYLINAIMIPYHNLPGVFENNIYGSTVNGSLWTLIVEFGCYIFIYFVYKFKLLNNKKFPYVFIMSLIGMICGYIVIEKLGVSILIAMIRPFAMFIIGALMYLIKDKISIKNWMSVPLILLSVLCILIKSKFLIVISIYLFLIVIIKILCDNVKQLPDKYSFLGEISYPLYLVAFPVQQTFVHFFGGSMNVALNFALSLAVSIVLAIILNFLIEKPLK